MNILKQIVGIDMSKDKFDACLGTINTSQDESISKEKIFDNKSTGFNKFIQWVLANRVSDSIPLIFVMEVTGVYHENLAYFLDHKAFQVAIILPNKIRNFAKSLEGKSKTDPIDAMVITRFGLQRKLTLWSPPDPLLRTIKALSREYLSLKVIITEIKNQIHAKEYTYYNDKDTIKRKGKLLNVLITQTEQILTKIRELIKSNSTLNEKFQKMITIKGVGDITIITILAETSCFEHVSNINQLISYAGLDVVLNESGKKKGKTSISKKGNKFIRAALFMPAMSAARHNTKMKEVFLRLVNKGKNRKAAFIAVARKLLVLIYTLWKNDTVFIQNYKPSALAA